MEIRNDSAKRIWILRRGGYKKMSLEKVVNILSHALQSSHILSTRIKLFFSSIIQQEASFCTYRKGSLTVEAAVIVPLITGFFLSILFFFRIFLVQIAVEEALFLVGRTIAVESCLVESDATLYISAEALLKSTLLEEENIERYVIGGVLGVSLLESEFVGKEIELTADYYVKVPFDIFGSRGIWLTSKNTFKKWMGDLYSGSEEGEWVYITETGTVYHKDTNCRSLDLHIQEGILSEMSQVRGSNGQRYYACGRCAGGLSDSEAVYYTDYGRLYHGALTCSALKRTILRVQLSLVGERPPCSFCY